MSPDAPGPEAGDRRLAILLAMAMFVLVVDTTGAFAMAVAQGLTAIILFWAIIGGLGASLLLPAMQSLIHGNFQGAAQKKAYALVGAAAAIAAAVGPLVGGFLTTFLSWRVGFLLEVVVIAIVLSGLGRIKDVPYAGPREIDAGAAVLSAVGMGGVVIGILVWQEGGEFVGLLIAVGLVALGGAMIALPIYLQMVLEYNALETGLILAPLSLTMFATALVAGKRTGRRRPAPSSAPGRGC